MKKLKSFLWSFYKNVIVKKKLKAFFILFFTKGGRKSVNRLYELTKNCTKIEYRNIDYTDIDLGHPVIYKQYALDLFSSEKDIYICPIKVVRYQHGNGLYRYLVVDGNHRLWALQLRAMRTDGTIFCEVMV